MKIQSLAIIFLIIILPISLVLTSYIQTRIDTIGLQATYDSKLNDAIFLDKILFALTIYNSSIIIVLYIFVKWRYKNGKSKSKTEKESYN